MTTPASVQWNSRERALSSDLNRQAALNARALAEAMAALSTGTLKQSGCFGSSFIVAPQGGTMKCSIAPGIALLYDSTIVHPASTMKWIESAVLREVTLDAGDGNPRYDVVEMRSGIATTVTSPRDQFNPLTGTFTVINMAKETASYPEFQVRKGTAAVVPTIPAGTGGWMPLAYVLVPAAAVTLLANNVIHCRPILDAQPGRGWTDPALTRYATSVKGGGINVVAGVAALASDVTGRFPGAHSDFRIEATNLMDFGTMVWDGGGAPGVSGAMYFYAVPAPYPAGYDSSMAPRELWTPDKDAMYGNTSGFYDHDKQEGCIIVASFTAPLLDRASGAAAGSGTINNTFFSVAASVLDRSKWVYLGSASYDHTAVVLGTQTAAGPEIATDRKTGYNFLADMPIGADALHGMLTEVTTNIVRWPTTARRIQAQIVATLDAAGFILANIKDDFSGASTPWGWHRCAIANTSGSPIVATDTRQVTLNAAGQLTLGAGTLHVTATTAHVVGRSYTDTVLALR